MEPKIEEGSIVIVNKSDTGYEANKTYLVVHKNQPLIKNIFDANKDYFILSSFNPEFEPFLASKNETQILGRVRAVINNF
jgi:phage repressor protein C with HTH and peptisase S24 domain